MALPGNPNQILIFKYPLRFLSPSPAPPPVAWILFVIILIPAKHCIVKAGGGVCVVFSFSFFPLFFFFPSLSLLPLCCGKAEAIVISEQRVPVYRATRISGFVHSKPSAFLHILEAGKHLDFFFALPQTETERQFELP